MNTLLKFLLLILSIQNIFSLHFDLSQESSRCIIEEFFVGSVAVVKYKFWSTPNNIEKVKSLINNIHISITKTDSKELLKVETVKTLKDKFSFLSKEDTYYKICVERSNVYWMDKDPIYFQLRVMSDNMDEPNISTAIKTKDLAAVKDKVQKVIKKGERLIKTQESELVEEDKAAKRQMETIGYYYSMAVIQIVVVIGLGLYQIFAFRKFFMNYKSHESI